MGWRGMLRDLQISSPCPGGEIGRHRGLKIPRSLRSCRFKSGSGHHTKARILIAIRGEGIILDATSIGSECFYRFTEYAKRLAKHAKG